MRYRHLGNSGLEVSESGLGTNSFGMRLDAAESAAIVRAAVESGVTFIDTSRVYAEGLSEEYIGLALDGGLRHNAVICTKFGSMREYGPNKFGGGRKHVIESVEGSLTRLRTDYIDVYMMHRPDPRLPTEEVLRTMDDLVRQGKVRYIGTCNTPAWWLVEMVWTCRANGLEPMVSTSFEYSLANRAAEEEMVPACRELGVGVIPYWPLAQGLLTGKYSPGQTAPSGSRFEAEPATADKRMTVDNRGLLEDLKAFAGGQGRGVRELAFAWLLSKEVTATVIAGASTPEQARQNAAASGWQLTSDEIIEVERILAAHPSKPGEGYYSVANYFDTLVEIKSS